MAVKPLTELLSSLNTIIGENTSDEALTLIEDITDSFNAKAEDDSVDWKKKYEDNDSAWRTRYKERFLSGDTSLDDDIDDKPSDNEVKTYKFEDLFKEG